MSAYVTWRLDPTLSPARSFPPVVAEQVQARWALAQVARKRKRSAGGSAGPNSAKGSS